MKFRRPLASATTFALLAFALSGCGEPDAVSSDDGTWKMGPLDEFRARIDGRSWDPDADWYAALHEESRLIAQMVIDCMAAQGFNYYVHEVGHNTSFGSPDPDAEVLTDLEHAERFGFGISHVDESTVFTMPPNWFDPNAEQLAAMSAAEEAAWREAAHGTRTHLDDSEDWWTNTGCYGQAQEIVWRLTTDDQFAGLEDEMRRNQDRIFDSPRILQMQADWAICMNDRGFTDLTTQGALTMGLWDEWELLNGWGAFNEIVADWDWEAFPSGPDLPERSPAAIEEFQTRELQLAVASYHCDAEVDRWGVWREVDHELQAEFVERHAAELEAWASFEEQRRANIGQ